MNEKKGVIGIIGMGDMGRMYARRLAEDGYMIHCCDLPERTASLRGEFGRAQTIRVLDNGHLVSRSSDYIIYSVEAAAMDAVVALYGPSTRIGAIVGGQTSCKAPEMAAFEAHLPPDVEIVSCHSLHGPNVDPRGQPLVIVPHRACEESIVSVECMLACFHSQTVRLSAAAHDRITADTQAVTHAAFLSMGVAWHANDQYPWQVARYTGGIENVKSNLALRIFANKPHVYAGLAIFNPAARVQIAQYAQSVTELFKLMLARSEQAFTARVRAAGTYVFGERKRQLLLRDDVLDRFSLSNVPREARRPNSHLSLLAMVDCWHRLHISPYDHMICSTPLFRIWLGVGEYLFADPLLLTESIHTAIHDETFRSDDLEFTFAARGWSECVQSGDVAAFERRFAGPRAYFAPRFPEAIALGNDMIRTIFDRLHSD